MLILPPSNFSKAILKTVTTTILDAFNQKNGHKGDWKPAPVLSGTFSPNISI